MNKWKIFNCFFCECFIILKVFYREVKTKLLSWNDKLITKQTLKLMWDTVCVLQVSGINSRLFYHVCKVYSDVPAVEVYSFLLSGELGGESGGTRTGVLRAAREDNKSCRRSNAWGPEQQSKHCGWNIWWGRGGGREGGAEWVAFKHETELERCVLERHE